MKKIFFVLAIITVAALVSSCKSHEKCPAYGHSGNPSTAKHS